MSSIKSGIKGYIEINNNYNGVDAPDLRKPVRENYRNGKDTLIAQHYKVVKDGHVIANKTYIAIVEPDLDSKYCFENFIIREFPSREIIGKCGYIGVMTDSIKSCGLGRNSSVYSVDKACNALLAATYD